MAAVPYWKELITARVGLRTIVLGGVLLAFPPNANAQSGATPSKPATQPAAQQSPVTLPGGFTLDVHGLLRIRLNGYANFDLDKQDRRDDFLRFFDARSYLDLRVQKGPFAFVSSVDLAGNEFNDGAILGNDQPPLGAAGLRELELRVRQVAFEYHGPVRIEMGRIPHQLGQGIVTHIFRDSIRVARIVGPVTLVGSWVFGGEGVTRVDPLDASPGVENSPIGTAENLDAFLVLGNWSPRPAHRLQTFVAWQVDTTFNDRNPEKVFLDLNGSGALGRLGYAFELVYEGGQTPAAGTRALATDVLPTGPRQDNRATLIFLTAGYQLVGTPPPTQPVVYQIANRVRPPGTLGLRIGRGSGDDNPTDRHQKHFENLFMDETGFTYTFLFSDDLHGFTGRAADLRRGSGFANVTFVQPYLQFRLVPALNVFGSYTYLRATRGQPLGAGILGVGAVLPPAIRRTRNIGHEVDLLIDHDVDPAVRLFAYGGVFVPGKIFDLAAARAWKVEIGVEYRF